MLETFLGLIVFLGLASAYLYFFVIKPKMDKKPPAVAPVTVLKEESGNYLGAGNPIGNGDRPLWKFKLPGSSYGKGIEVWYGVGTDLAKIFTVHDGAIRTDGPGYALWKPISDEAPPTLVIHAAGGSTANRCVIKFSV